jgi:hypothetical protein
VPSRSGPCQPVALSFTVSATDPDGDALAYSASNLPTGAAFDLAVFCSQASGSVHFILDINGYFQ